MHAIPRDASTTHTCTGCSRLYTQHPEVVITGHTDTPDTLHALVYGGQYVLLDSDNKFLLLSSVRNLL